MGRRHFKPWQIIPMPREADIKLAGLKAKGHVDGWHRTAGL